MRPVLYCSWVPIIRSRGFTTIGDDIIHVLHIEHPVPDYARWKAAFDSDPIDRAASGVVAYHVFRPVDDDRYIITDLEFADVDHANSALAKLRALWQRVDVVAGGAPITRILEVVETGQPA